MGFVLFQSALLRIWNSVNFLKLVNCLFCAGNTLLIYLIAKEFVTQKSAKIVAGIYCFFPFSVFYVTILSNQFASSFFSYLGLYILIAKYKNNEYIKYLIVAGLLVISNVLRPEGIIPLVSILLYLLLSIRKENYKHKFLSLFILISSYFVLKMAVGKLFAMANIAPFGLSNNDPLWKFVMGFDHRSQGSYYEAGNFYSSNGEALSLIQDRVLQPIHKLLYLFTNKIHKFWDGSAINWIFNPLKESGTYVLGVNFPINNLSKFTGDYSSGISITMYILLLIGLVTYIKKGCCSNKILMIFSQVFVTFGVYLLIEVQPRYIYHVQLSVFILAALGIDTVENLLKDSKKKLLADLVGKE